MKPTKTKNFCCSFAYVELFVYGINREITSWKMMMQEDVRVGGVIFYPSPYQTILFVGLLIPLIVRS